MQEPRRYEIILDKTVSHETESGYIFPLSLFNINQAAYYVSYTTSDITVALYRLTSEDYIAIDGQRHYWNKPTIYSSIIEYQEMFNYLFPDVVLSLDDQSKTMQIDFADGQPHALEMSHNLQTLFSFPKLSFGSTILAQSPPNLLSTNFIHIFLHPNAFAPKSFLTAEAHLIATAGYRPLSNITNAMPHQGYKIGSVPGYFLLEFRSSYGIPIKQISDFKVVVTLTELPNYGPITIAASPYQEPQDDTE